MTSQQLKEYIIEHDKVEFILEDLGCHSIEFHPDKEYWSAAHPDGDNKSGIIIKNNNYLNYYSYSRNINIDEGKDIFYLVQKTKKFTFAETMKYVHKLLGLKYTFKKDKPKEETEEKSNPLAIFQNVFKRRHIVNVLDFKPLDENILDNYEPTIHIDLFREGIIGKTIKKFGLMYSYKWKRTIFPHRFWSTGELIGINARSSIENCEELGITKYFITPGMPKSINFYGLWENYKDIEKAGYITIFEAEKSVLKRDSLNDATAVALSGHSISDEQVRIISGLDVYEVVIALDKDVPIEEVWHVCSKIFHLRKVSYIWDKYDLLGEKDSPADAPNKVYEFLFKYRVTYDEAMHERYLKSLEEKK